MGPTHFPEGSRLPNIEYGVVLGAPRSGTTFLMGFFDAMPATEAVSGNLLPTVIPHLMNQELPAVARDALMRAFRRSLDDYLDSAAFNSRAAALRKSLMVRGDFQSVRTGQRHIERIVYKEPFFAFAPEYAYESLVEARIIYILRDGRDVADSLVRTYDVLTDEKLSNLETNEVPVGRPVGGRFVPWWVDEGREEEFLSATPYVRATWMWAEMVRRCRTYFASRRVAEDGRVLQVRYEELVTDPVHWGERITAHLGATMTTRMRQRIASARTSSVGIHKRRDADEVAEATRVARAELELNGYL